MSIENDLGQNGGLNRCPMNVEHIESPEAISRAVKHGYRPEEMLRKSIKMLESMGETNEAYIREIMDKTLKSWIEMVDKSETPWALCDNCHGAIQAYIKHKEAFK